MTHWSQKVRTGHPDDGEGYNRYINSTEIVTSYLMAKNDGSLKKTKVSTNNLSIAI